MEASDGVQPVGGAEVREASGAPAAPARPLDDAAPPRYASGHALAMWVIGFLVALLLIELADVLADINEILLFRSKIAGAVISNPEIELNDASQQLLGMGQQLAMVGLALLVPLWLWRAYRNAPALGAHELSFRSHWALLGWFVPVLCFFVPFQIVRETWQASALGEDVSTARSRKMVPTSPLLGAWWLAWWLSLSMTASSVGMILRAKETERLTDGLTSSWLDLLASILAIIAVASLIYIVRAIDRRQDEKSWWMAGVDGAALGRQALRRGAVVRRVRHGGGGQSRHADHIGDGDDLT